MKHEWKSKRSHEWKPKLLEAKHLRKIAFVWLNADANNSGYKYRNFIASTKKPSRHRGKFWSIANKWIPLGTSQNFAPVFAFSSCFSSRLTWFCHDEYLWCEKNQEKNKKKKKNKRNRLFFFWFFSKKEPQKTPKEHVLFKKEPKKSNFETPHLFEWPLPSPVQAFEKMCVCASDA